MNLSLTWTIGLALLLSFPGGLSKFSFSLVGLIFLLLPNIPSLKVMFSASYKGRYKFALAVTFIISTIFLSFNISKTMGSRRTMTDMCGKAMSPVTCLCPALEKTESEMGKENDFYFLISRI